MGTINHVLQGLQHRRMEEIEQIGDPWIVAIDRQQVLGQVIGTNRKEVDLTR
jgi:hypothetical protein